MKSLPSLLTALALLCGSTFFLAEAQELRLTTSDAKAQFDKADQALNAAWNAAKSKLLEEDFARLKLDQRNWLIYRDNLARSPIFAGGDGQGELALTSPYYLTAAAALEEERTKWVLGLIRDWDWNNDRAFNSLAQSGRLEKGQRLYEVSGSTTKSNPRCLHTTV